MALMVLYVPSTSMSMTVLNALELRPSMGEMKLPAAPALQKAGQQMDARSEYRLGLPVSKP